MRFQKTLDQIQRAAGIPMQLFAPVRRFFFQKRFQLAHCGLSKVDDIHERVRIALAGPKHHSWQPKVNKARGTSQTARNGYWLHHSNEWEAKSLRSSQLN